ncbi:MAG: helix-turn-helix transcriptional regulator [Dehalococcoidia bacterium]|nr:helix-turn-helix transcriptional regulator [Dehalococcoidia bacterium]
MKGRGPVAGLTDRQRQVLEFISRGKTNFEIANTLGITLDGAKWHVREIMAKLGCDTREEAVAIWQGRPSAPRRVARQLARPFAVFGTAFGKAAAVLAAGGVALAVVAVFAFSRGDDAATESDSEAATEVIPTSAPTQPTPIAFRSCGTSTFRRPSIAEMAQTFSNPRFAGPLADASVTQVARPAPLYFSFYLTKVYQIVPRAISANVENTALSGEQQNQTSQPLIAPFTPCDQAFLMDLSITYYMFRFVDIVPRSASLEGATLTITADVLPGSTTLFTLPDPPPPANTPPPSKDPFEGLPPFEELRVVTPDGALLYSRGSDGTVQYAPTGALMMATTAFGQPWITIEIRGSPQNIVGYSQASTVRPAVVSDSTGKYWNSEPAQPAPETWAEVYRKELPPGRYNITGVQLLVPAGTPLP